MSEASRRAAGRSTRWWVERVLLAAATLAMVLGAAAPAEDEAGRVLFVGASVLSILLVGLAWHQGDVTTSEALGVAVLLRLLAFPLLPGLSDDGFRYLWDGLVQTEGLNPYALRPSDPTLEALRDPGQYDHLNSADYYSVYPPSSQLVFWVGGWATGLGWTVGWYTIKVVFVAIELAGVWALSRMVPARLLVLYAWHPLAVIEVAGQAHTEAGMVGFLLLGLLAYQQQWPRTAVGLLTVAGWFKLYPLLLLPFLLRRVGWRYAWAGGAVSLALLAPYVHPSALTHGAESLDLYVRSFEFYAGPYLALKEVGAGLTGEDWSKSLGPALRTLFLIGVAARYFADQRRNWPFVHVCLFVFGLLWATATTVHPWYLLGVLALLPLVLTERPGRVQNLHAAAWIWLILIALGTYLFYSHGEAIYWTTVWIGWGGWAVGLLTAMLLRGLPRLMRRRARRKWRWFAPHAGTPRRLLDLGAGEGYVGSVARDATGAEVMLADVVDFNRTDLPHIVYDGKRLPFADHAFDVTLLVFVLHHARDAAEVLREVRRVTTTRVLVIESVFERMWERRWLETADRLANRLRSGGRMRGQEDFLHVRRVADWREVFAAQGFRVVGEDRRGGWWHRQHLFVLERV